MIPSTKKFTFRLLYQAPFLSSCRHNPQTTISVLSICLIHFSLFAAHLVYTVMQLKIYASFSRLKFCSRGCSSVVLLISIDLIAVNAAVKSFLSCFIASKLVHSRNATSMDAWSTKDFDKYCNDASGFPHSLMIIFI